MRTETPYALRDGYDSIYKPDVAFVYATHDQERQSVKFGMSKVPGTRLQAQRRKFGPHVELKATWLFPSRKDAYAVGQYVHSLIGSAYQTGHHMSEWFRVAPDGWEFIGKLLDRASVEIYRCAFCRRMDRKAS